MRQSVPLSAAPATIGCQGGKTVPTREKESYSIQSVDNALDVLEALCEEGDEVRISQLSERLGMNKTSVFRLLATFENRGYVEREKGSGKYRLGLSAYEMGQKFLSRMHLLRKAKPIMERLVRQVNEAVYLAVPRDPSILLLDMVDTSAQVKIVSLAGNRYQISATAAGKVILASRVAGNGSSHGSNGKKGRDVPALSPAEQQTIARDGFCLDRGGLGEGVVSVAVPLFRSGGEVVGSLCCVGPDFRMTDERLQEEILPQIKDAGDIISSKLGHLGRYFDGEHD